MQHAFVGLFCSCLPPRRSAAGEVTARELENIGFRPQRMLDFREYNEALKLPDAEEWERRFLQR